MYLTSHHPADALKASETDLRDGVYWVKTNKTKAHYEIVGALAELIDRILARRREHNVRSLKLLIDLDGTPLAATALRSKFDRARERLAA